MTRRNYTVDIRQLNDGPKYCANGNAPLVTTQESYTSDVTVTSEEAPRLKKQVGLISGVSFIVGTMIGSGIFVSPAGLARGAGSVGLCLVTWTACGLLSTCGALCLAELGTLIQESGAEYAYIKAALGPGPAYMFSWVSMLLLKPASCSIIALTCAEYIMVPSFSDGCGSPPELHTKLVAVLVILLLTAVNAFSVKLAARIQIVFTIAKLLALIVIIIGGLVRIAQGHTEYLSTGFQGTSGAIGPIAIGIYNGMWAYDGWNNLNYVTEELENPQKNLPRAILIALPLVTVCYLLVNVSYFSVMSVDQLIDSPAVAVTWSQSLFPGVSWVIPLMVVFSTFGAANGTMFAGGRLTYVASRDGHMVSILSYVHVEKLTPMPSLVFTCVLSLLFIIPGDISSLIDVFSFAVWLFYGLTMLSLIVLRFTMKDAHRPYKVPLVVPVLVMCASLFLVVTPIIDNPQVEFIYATLFILGGLLFYVPFVHFKLELPYMDHVNLFLQKLMEVTPPVSEPSE